MAVINLRSQVFKARFNDFLFSSIENSRSLVLLHGIYSGFKVSKVGSTLRIEPGTDVRNVAVINNGAYSITFVSTDTYNLDFTGFTAYPTYVVLEGIYVESADTVGAIKTVSAANLRPEHVKICQVLDSSLNFDVSYSSRDWGLVRGPEVKDISDTATPGISNAYAGDGHVHAGVRFISANAPLQVDNNYGDVTVSLGDVIWTVDHVDVQGTAHGLSARRYGTPVKAAVVAGNVRFTSSGSPKMGFLVNDTPADNSDINVRIIGEVLVHPSVFVSIVTRNDIGKAVFADASANLRLTAPIGVAVQRIGVIKNLIGADILVIVKPSLNQYEFD